MDNELMQLARIIYDAVYAPGRDHGDGEPMPPFDASGDLGEHERAVEAARRILAYRDSDGVSEAGNVAPVSDRPMGDIPAGRVLSVATKAGLQNAMVVGTEAGGKFYFASSRGDQPADLWSLERAKLILLSAGGAMPGDDDHG